ncbi:cystatin-B-like isoform X3 [Epinephelus fuscoguttatus]|uniref:cystatin-B-like isoform X2 n=1 Tax=Epinephelus fuscoguttatus TaxID=293821 RepID=UPI0020D1DE9F|nr:cystatin-B-like isoform X2 [Epinephelus fuscoguttatus]XP_049421856.1 cystatin-B-like isoform X3 [Epinephelus fuscoguttatus]
MATGMGEWSETKDATEETQKICDQVKDKVEKKTGENYGVYTAVKYREIVDEQSFLFKVHVGGEDYIHLSVFQIPLLVHGAPDPKEILRGVEQHKTKYDPSYLLQTKNTTLTQIFDVGKLQVESLYSKDIIKIKALKKINMYFLWLYAAFACLL